MVLLAGSILAPVTSHAATPEISITGSGWGHGVGLSQYGAKAMGADGATYQQIVHRYFTGVSIVPVGAAAPGTFLATDTTPLWVGLLQNQTGVTFSVSGDAARLCFDGPDLCSQIAHPGQVWRFGPDASGLCVFQKKQVNGTFDPRGVSNPCNASVRPISNDATLSVPFKARFYRDGILRFRSSPVQGRLHVALEIGLENYLKGLSEVPDSWPAATIKAQVVSTRSATAWHLLAAGSAESFDNARREDCFCNIRDGGSNPVFRGATGADGHPNWVTAVEATASEVMRTTYGLAIGMHSSSSGGETENYADVFGPPEFSHLVSVADSAAFSDSAVNPHVSWKAGYARRTLADAFDFSWVTDVTVEERNDSGSAHTVLVSGIRDGRPALEAISGVEFRSALSLRSTTLDFRVLPRFQDVPLGHLFGGEILGLSELGITHGCTVVEFCPQASVTRGEMAAFIVRALGLELPQGGNSFSDDDRSVFEKHIEALYAQGVTNGCMATKFCPEDRVTRGEMAAFLTRAFRLPTSSEDPFRDDDGSIFEADIGALEASGITGGCADGYFCPSRLVSRQEMAAFLIRALALE